MHIIENMIDKNEYSDKAKVEKSLVTVIILAGMVVVNKLKMDDLAELFIHNLQYKSITFNIFILMFDRYTECN